MRYTTYRLYGREIHTVDKHDLMILLLIWLIALAVAVGGLWYMNYQINSMLQQSKNYQYQQSQKGY